MWGRGLETPATPDPAPWRWPGTDVAQAPRPALFAMRGSPPQSGALGWWSGVCLASVSPEFKAQYHHHHQNKKNP